MPRPIECLKPNSPRPCELAAQVCGEPLSYELLRPRHFRSGYLIGLLQKWRTPSVDDNEHTCGISNRSQTGSCAACAAAQVPSSTHSATAAPGPKPRSSRNCARPQATLEPHPPSHVLKPRPSHSRSRVARSSRSRAARSSRSRARTPSHASATAAPGPQATAAPAPQATLQPQPKPRAQATEAALEPRAQAAARDLATFPAT